MHNIKLISRHFPHQQKAVIGISLFVSGSALAVGIGLRLLQ